jgi:hypothetical protein
MLSPQIQLETAVRFRAPLNLLHQALNRASISNHQRKSQLGESLSAEGVRRTIRFIVATQVEKDYQVPNWSIKNGQYFCVAAETTDDLGKGQAHCVWLDDCVARVGGLELANVALTRRALHRG